MAELVLRAVLVDHATLVRFTEQHHDVEWHIAAECELHSGDGELALGTDRGRDRKCDGDGSQQADPWPEGESSDPAHYGENRARSHARC